MTTVAPSIANFDPQSREYLLDPQAAVQQLFAESPVFYHQPLNVHFVLPYDEVRRVLDDYETYFLPRLQGTAGAAATCATASPRSGSASAR